MFTDKGLKNLILPLFVEQFLLMFVGIADTFVVSFSSEADVSGVSLVTSFNTVLIFLFTALSSGGAVIISQYIGLPLLRSAPDDLRGHFRRYGGVDPPVPHAASASPVRQDRSGRDGGLPVLPLDHDALPPLSRHLRRGRGPVPEHRQDQCDHGHFPRRQHRQRDRQLRGRVRPEAGRGGRGRL